MKERVTMRPIAILFLLLAASAPASAQAKKIQLQPCRPAGWTRDVMCGTYEVFEDRRAKTGRKIALKIVVLPALAAGPRPDPIFYFAGGPGGSATETIERSGETYLADLNRDRDLVFVDQRGTGGSNRLDCPFYADRNDMSAFFAELFPIDRLRACASELQKRADLTLYTTEIAVEDVDEVRAALGYDKINLYGGSYGSTVAMAYMRQYPRHVRTATLVGVAPPDARLPLPFAKGVQNALDRLFADCAADERCRAAYPDLKADLAAAVTRLDKGPVSVEAVNPFTRQPQTVTLTRAAFVEAVRAMLYTQEVSRWMPLVLHRAAGGEFASFVVLGYQSFRALEDQIARGMHFSVVTADYLPFATEADAEREMGGTFYGNGRWKAYRRAADVWPKPRVTKAFASPVASDLPVLLIDGEADPVTPPWLAEAAARHLPNGRVVVVPHSGHAFSFPCVDALVAEVVAKGSAKQLDVSCVAQTRRPPFITEAMLGGARTETPPAPGQEVWEGVLDVGQAKLRLVLKISTVDGKLKATLDSPDQGAFGLAIDTITRKDGAVHFEMSPINAAFDGTTDASGSTITGQWTQGRSWPLVFKRK